MIPHANVTVVWLEEGTAPDTARALEEWARARGVHLAAPRAVSEKNVVIDFSVSDRIEGELAKAREAFVQLDTDAAEHALARAEALVLEHPELPHAAWLRAEVERGWAARYSRLEPHDEERASLAWQRANALGGPRALALTETGSKNEPPRVHARALLPTNGDEVFFDGALLTTRDITTTEGPHDLRVTRDGTTIRAMWVGFGEGTEVDLRENENEGPCSSGDFTHVKRTGEGVTSNGVRCPNWIAVMPAKYAGANAAPGAIEFAVCDGAQCTSFLEWRASGAIPPELLAPGKKHWPRWATWTLTGVGAATVAVVVIIATGALEARPKEPRFDVGPVTIQSWR